LQYIGQYQYDLVLERRRIESQMLLLRRMAQFCAKLQLTSAFTSAILFTFFPNDQISVYISGYTALLVSLVPLVYCFVNKMIVLIFSCLVIFNVAPIWFLYLEAVLPGYDAHDNIQPEYIVLTILYVAIFQFSFNAYYALLWKPVSRRSIRFFKFLNFLNFGTGFYTKTALVAFILPLVAFYFYYGSGEVLWRALTAGRSGGGGTGLIMRSAVGDSSAFMLPLVWIWQLVPLLSSIALIRSARGNRFMPGLAFFFGLLVIFVFFLGGSRSAMVFVAAPVLFFFFYYNRNKGIKFWILAGFLMTFFIGVMEFQVRFRGNLLEVIADPAKAAAARGLSSATTFDLTESHRDNNMYLFCLMVKSYPDQYDFEGFNDFFATLLNPVPRALWPNKPLMAGAKDLSTQRSFILEGPLNIGTTSLTFSIVGNAYLASGLLGILIYSLIYTLFCLFFDGLLFFSLPEDPLTIGILAIGIFLAFWGYRDFFALVSFLYPLLLLIFVLKFIHFLKSR